jgi:DNA-binding transcriptional MerR regulator
MSKLVIDSFLIAHAAKLSGLTTYMVDYLCREDILVPQVRGRRGRGRPRRYSFGDVVMLRVIARLLKSGVSVKRLKRALKTLRPYHRNISRDTLMTNYFVTDGRQVFLHDKEALIDLDGSGQMSFMFVLELEDVRQDVLRVQLKGYAHGQT